MLFSFALIFLCGFALGSKRIKLPPLLSYMITGIVPGPYVLNLIDGSILDASASLRKVALIIILLRAGLKMDIETLKKVGRPAIGSIPLWMGLSCGNAVFTVAVCEILITAPPGAFMINMTYQKLLKKAD